MMNQVPCPKCANKSGFISERDKTTKIIKDCFTCNDTLMISEEHNELLNLGFKETFEPIDEYSLSYHLRNRNTPFYINFKIKVDAENVPYIASTDISWMDKPKFDSVADVIRFIKTHNKRKK
jgi:hypothetical protein